jgi:transposase
MREKIAFNYTKEQQDSIYRMLRKRNLSKQVSDRAKIIKLLMDGKSGYAVAAELIMSISTVYTWRDRFQKDGVDGLKDLPRSGQPRKISDETVTKVLSMTMSNLPEESTRWSVRLMSKYAGVTPYQVRTIWKSAKIRPHLVSTFNFSKDPKFAEKVIDIVGLYMDKPENAIVLSVDEKTQTQALDHTQPLLQLRPGQVERHTHDYVRHGTTSLYAAFNITSGKVIGRTVQRHRSKEFISFMNLVDRRMKALKSRDTIHIILDNSSTHKTKEVQAWQKRHPEYHFHFTPTSSSWLNAVEGWFSQVERFGLTGKAFKSVQQLKLSLKNFIVTFNKHSAKPFKWTKDADTILASVARASKALKAQKNRVVIARD